MFNLNTICHFDSRGTDSSLKVRDGESCIIIHVLTPAEADIVEVGNMYRVRFSDGFEADAFEDELCAWTATMPSLSVITPDGTIIAEACGGSEYPGICISLLHGNGERVSLALVEHIPGGSYVGDDRDQKLIPDSRVTELESQPSARFTPGLMTRVWVDECHNPDDHITIAHNGYTDKT